MFISQILAQAAGGPNPLSGVIPLIGIFLVMYFLIFRPQQQKAKEHQEMVAAIRRGDAVVTGGGIYAKVTKVIDDKQVEIEIADGVRIKIVRSAIAEIDKKANPS